MAKIRVYELARDLNMTNKVLLSNIKKNGIKVKSHMSSLDDDTVKRIKASLLGKTGEKRFEEKRVKTTVIRRRKKISENIDTEVVVNEDNLVSSDKNVKVDNKVENMEQEVQASENLDFSYTKDKSSKKSLQNQVLEDKKSLEKDNSSTDDNVQSDMSAGVKKEQISESDNIEENTLNTKSIAVEEDKSNKFISEEVTVSANSGTDNKQPSKKKKFKAAKIIKLPKPVPVISKIPKKTSFVKNSKPSSVQGKQKNVPKKSDGKEHVRSEADEKKDFLKKGDDNTNRKERDKGFLKKKISFRKKAIVEGNALYDGGGKHYGKGRKKKGKVRSVEAQKTAITTPKAIKRRIKIDDTIVLSDLAKRMGVKSNEMIQKLMLSGVMVTVNQTIDFETAEIVASEFSYELDRASFEEESFMVNKSKDDSGVQVARPPVVTIMGHVDHGKTSLLDVIRKSKITTLEAGGITQHIGAYNVKTKNGQIVFLDTPGHEAFTSMRSRGAKITDIVILVVAADDGVMPQTIEAINHSKAAKVPVIVAVNKIDKEDADPERVKRELSEHGIVSEDWGGENIFMNISAKQNIGINELLAMILLQSEMLELKANPKKFARGHVVEAKLDSGRGPVATILVAEGTLKLGEAIVCGVHHGKVRAMADDCGQKITSAGPSIPVEVLGLSGVPLAGDELVAIEDEKNAKQVGEHRAKKLRAKELAKNSRLTLDALFEKMQEGEVKELNLIIKADVHGSIEAISESLIKLSGDEVKINVIHSATGTISESDVSLASVSNAIIIGFNVRPGLKVRYFAEEENVDMRFYDIIYNVIKDIKDAMVGIMDSTYKERNLGQAEVREVFVIPKKGSIAGSYVLDGKIERGQMARLVRDGVVITEGKISSLRRFKDDIKDVSTGYECGIGMEYFNDIKVKDIIECYYIEEIKPKMD